MSGTITVTVTQEDIDNGMRHTPCACPIALATAREAGTGCDVSVGATRLNIYRAGPASRTRYRLPGDARDFICRFDLDLSVRPFTFTAEEIPGA
jgi:hypothetical protein